MVGGLEHHALYANPGQYPAKEQPLLRSRAVYVRTREQQLSQSGGEQLNYGGRSMRNRTYAYIGTRKRFGACALKAQCTSGVFRFSSQGFESGIWMRLEK